jgi:Hemerythrin HHE cation binding domain
VTIATAANGIEVQLLEQEHRRIHDGLAAIQETMARAGSLARPDVIDRVVRTLGWVRKDLLPHAAWEEAWLYPALDASATTPWATRALRFAHEQIREVATALEVEFAAAEARWSTEQAYRLIVALTRLETLVSAHMAQEAWFVEPLLEHHIAGRSDTKEEPS